MCLSLRNHACMGNPTSQEQKTLQDASRELNLLKSQTQRKTLGFIFLDKNLLISLQRAKFHCCTFKQNLFYCFFPYIFHTLPAPPRLPYPSSSLSPLLSHGTFAFPQHLSSFSRSLLTTHMVHTFSSVSCYIRTHTKSQALHRRENQLVHLRVT